MLLRITADSDARKGTDKKTPHEDWKPFATDKPVEVSRYALNKHEATQRTAQAQSTCL
jgi:hypothetical protein